MRQDYRNYILIGILILGLYFVVKPASIFDFNIVQLTSDSPTITVGSVQYKYEIVPLTYSSNVMSAIALSCDNHVYGYKCVAGTAAFDPGHSLYYQPPHNFGTIIGRVGTHEFVMEYEYYTLSYYNSNMGGTCGTQPGYTNVWKGEIIVTRATLDGQTLSMTPQSIAMSTETAVRDIWIPAGDFMMKVEANGLQTVSNEPCVSTGNYAFKFYLYAPSKYFKQSFCGDANCDLGETCGTCTQDCGVCPPSCGDNICSASENCLSCAQDCNACPDVCGDSQCKGGETCSICPQDCGSCPPRCGDSQCNGGETCATCTQDCGSCINASCGDGACNGNENCGTCTQDCGYCPAVCGNNLCQNEETPLSCPADCGLPANLCGNNACDASESCLCSDCKCGQGYVCSPGASGADQRGCLMQASQPSQPSQPTQQTEEPTQPGGETCTPGVDCEVIQTQDWFSQEIIGGVKNWQLILVIAVIIFVWQRKPIMRRLRR